MLQSKTLLIFLLLICLSSCVKKVYSLEKVKIETLEVSSISLSMYNKITAKAYGVIVDHNSYMSAVESGFCFSEHPTSTLSDRVVKNWENKQIMKFNIELNDLNPNSTYYIRAYVKTYNDVKYGEEITFDTPSLYPNKIGDAIQGGILAYIFQPGDAPYIAGEFHGIVAAPFDQSTGATWNGGNPIGTPGTTEETIGSGAANTLAIVSYYNSGTYAAKICNDLVLGGYIDWYLPSSNELYQVYKAKHVIGGFANDYYWSSSCFDNDFSDAWDVDFSGANGPSYYFSFNVERVRAIRSF